LMCFAWLSVQTAIIILYTLSWFIAETECVVFAVLAGVLYWIRVYVRRAQQIYSN